MAFGEEEVRPLANGTHSPHKPIELSIGLPHSLGTRIHIHLTVLATSLVLFLTSASLEGGTAGTALGSLVYAIPDKYNETQSISTPLYSLPSSLDFTTRMAKVLVRRTKKLCYVGGSINLANAASGGSVDEEMEAFRAIVNVVASEVAKANAQAEED